MAAPRPSGDSRSPAAGRPRTSRGPILVAEVVTRTRAARWLWAGSALFVLYGSTIPFRFQWDLAPALAKLTELSKHPMTAIGQAGHLSVSDVAQNVLLFVPFGALGIVALRGRVRSFAGRLAAVTVLASLVSVMAEALQLFTTDRVSSLTDVAAAVLGAVAGAVGMTIGGHIFERWMARARSLGWTGVSGFYPALVSVLFVSVGSWEPLDVTLDAGTIWSKLKIFRADPWQGALNDDALQLVRFAILVVVIALWLRQLRVRRAVSLATCACAVGGLALEASQLFIGARMPGLEDALANVAGALVGGVVSVAIISRHSISTQQAALIDSRSAALLLLVVLWAAAAVQMLSPFMIAPVRRPFVWMPFLSYYQFTSAETVSHTLELMMVYFPIGFVTPCFVRRTARACVVVLGIALAMQLPIEYFQGWIVGRYPDVTDIFVGMLGGIAGVWAGGPGWTRFEARGRAADGLVLIETTHRV